MKWIGKHIFGFDAIFRQDVTIDGNLTIAGTTTSLGDSDKIILGDGSDLQLYHDGTDSYLTNATGDLKIINYADDKDIILQSDDGSGGVETYFFLDGSVNRIVVNKELRAIDNINIKAGSGGDLGIYHNGTHSYILNGTGNLEIVNNTDDGDIILSSDNGSGSTTAYLTLDGGLGFTTAQKSIAFADGMSAFFGTDLDGLVSHSGTNMLISNEIGDLVISNRANDKDIILQSDDGSGGYTPYLTLDGSANYTTAQQEIRFDDAKAAQFGTSGDLVVWHTGTNSEIINYTGDLYIKQTLDDKDIIFQCDDGSGGLATYLTLDGGLGYTTASKSIRMADAQSFIVGSGFDGYLTHSGSAMALTNELGDLTIKNNANDKDIIFQSDNGAGSVTAYFFLDGSAAAHNGSFTTAVYTQWGDRSHIAIGGAKDMQLYHDGSNSYIEQIDGATGSLIIQQGVDDGDIIFNCDDDSGGVTAYLTLDGGDKSTIVNTIKVLMPNLPTSDPSVAGQLWNSSGDLRISAG